MGLMGQLEAMRGEKAAVEAENEELREKAAGVCAREEGLEARIVSLLEEEERLNESCDELQQRLVGPAPSPPISIPILVRSKVLVVLTRAFGC